MLVVQHTFTNYHVKFTQYTFILSVIESEESNYDYQLMGGTGKQNLNQFVYLYFFNEKLGKIYTIYPKINICNNIL